MATANTIIMRALRLCNVLASGEAMNAEEADDSLSVLNAMLSEWYRADIGLPDYSFALLATALASDDADAEAIAHQLAIRIAPEYGREISPLIMRNADESMGRMRLRYFQPGRADLTELPADSTFGPSNIFTGGF